MQSILFWRIYLDELVENLLARSHASKVHFCDSLNSNKNNDPEFASTVFIRDSLILIWTTIVPVFIFNVLASTEVLNKSM